MYPHVSWAVPADPHILEALAAYDGWQTPKNLELNTPFSRQWIAQRCQVYEDHGLAERHDSEPAYRCTDYGKRVVSGSVDFDELEPDE